jgi:hypothetical protein
MNERRRDRRGGDGLAGFASVLRADMAVDKAPGRLGIQLLSDVFAALDQVRTALPALAGFRFVPVLDAREMVG